MVCQTLLIEWSETSPHDAMWKVDKKIITRAYLLTGQEEQQAFQLSSCWLTVSHGNEFLTRRQEGRTHNRCNCPSESNMRNLSGDKACMEIAFADCNGILISLSLLTSLFLNATKQELPLLESCLSFTDFNFTASYNALSAAVATGKWTVSEISSIRNTARVKKPLVEQRQLDQIMQKWDNQ